MMALVPTSSTEEKSISEDEVKLLELKIASLPTLQEGWLSDKLYKYEGFWYARPFLDRVIQVNEIFKLRQNDVILATFQKSGTTWFTALLVALMNRNRYGFDNNSNHPLHTHSPLDFVRWIEFINFHSSDMNPPSLVKTHMPYTLLPDCIKSSNVCPVIYVCRNPLDVLVSVLNFNNIIRVKGSLSPLSLEEGFKMFCQGHIQNGPYWDHVLAYWNASIEKPYQVLFLRYEDMKAQPIIVMKKLASFVGCPFTTEEEQNGVIEKIIDFCSFVNLSSLEINKDDENERDDYPGLHITNKLLFRKGKVGDYVNFLTDEMIQRLKEITSIKFKDTGLDVFA